jgi:hypothetical protein
VAATTSCAISVPPGCRTSTPLPPTRLHQSHTRDTAGGVLKLLHGGGGDRCSLLGVRAGRAETDQVAPHAPKLHDRVRRTAQHSERHADRPRIRATRRGAGRSPGFPAARPPSLRHTMP